MFDSGHRRSAVPIQILEATVGSILEFLSHFNWLILPETVGKTFWHADWKGARERGGILGIANEAVQSLAGTNTWPFFVPMPSRKSGKDIERLLAQHGIKSWGWLFANGEMSFQVPRSQAAWAQYLIQREGVQLSGRLLAETPKASGQSSRRSGKSPGKPLEAYAKEAEQRLDDVIDNIGSALGI